MLPAISLIYCAASPAFEGSALTVELHALYFSYVTQPSFTHKTFLFPQSGSPSELHAMFHFHPSFRDNRCFAFIFHSTSESLDASEMIRFGNGGEKHKAENFHL